MTTFRRRIISSYPVLAMGLGLLLLVTASPGAEPPALPPDLEKVRAALEKYRDPYVAVRDGYFSTVGCMEFPRDSSGPGLMSYRAGSMGIHFLNPQLIGPVMDPLRPQILLYEPVDGKLNLVGAEWFVPLAVGIKEQPVLFGQPFDGPMEGHEPLLPQSLHHYDLHVWLWKANPNGVFSPTNPDVSCRGYAHTVMEHETHTVAGPGE